MFALLLVRSEYDPSELATGLGKLDTVISPLPAEALS